MDKIELGNHAKMIINNKAYTLIFEAVKAQYMEAWGRTTPDQEALRETIYNTVVALADVKHKIESLAVAGDNATFTKEAEDY